MSGLHAAMGPLFIASLAALAVIAAVVAWRGSPVAVPETGRKILLGLVVAQSAIGLALALRGSAPREWLHWIYGGVIVGIMLLPGMLADTTERRRSGAIAVAAALGVVVAWRLGASG